MSGHHQPITRLLVVPHDGNPYQELLYAPLRSAHPELKTTYWVRRRWVGLPHFFVLSLWSAAMGARLVHVHWVAWEVRGRVPLRRQISTATSMAAIWWLRALRFRIVWTVHNLLPHEAKTTNDLRISRLLARRCDAILVHSRSTVDAMDNAGLPTDKVTVVPHGNYADVYGPSLTRKNARVSLGLHEADRVLLFFGQIRPYKGLPDLLDAWERTTFPGLLVIAGSCDDPSTRVAIDEHARRDRSIIPYLDYVPEDRVSTFFSAADGVCLPFKEVTTSGSAHLALTFGKPLVAPRIGSLADWPDEFGFFYGGETDRDLTLALQEFFGTPDEKLAGRSVRVLAHATDLSWPAISDQVFKVYRSVLETPRRPARDASRSVAAASDSMLTEAQPH